IEIYDAHTKTRSFVELAPALFLLHEADLQSFGSLNAIFLELDHEHVPQIRMWSNRQANRSPPPGLARFSQPLAQWLAGRGSCLIVRLDDEDRSFCAIARSTRSMRSRSFRLAATFLAAFRES